MSWLVIGVERGRERSNQLLADLELSHKRLRDYAVQVEELATARERNRVARDIHDSVGHSLAAVNVQLEKALVFHNRDPDVTVQAMQDAKRAAKKALGDVRESVRTLRQSSEPFSLSESLTALVEHSQSEEWKGFQLGISRTSTFQPRGAVRPAGYSGTARAGGREIDSGEQPD